MKRDNWRRIVAGSLIVGLAGCGSAPPRVDGPSTGTTSVRKSTAVVQKRGGGYYKDDGPADEIPVNLDEIPDAQPQLEPLHRFANRPYVVLGRSYVPNTRLQPFHERGVASWYGKKFHGQMTSIGEPYDMFAMTAAHPTLAIPSYVRVTNVSNGKTVVVRVTDRGPFHADRIIDLSYAAAYRLGYVNDGSTVVDVEALLPTAPTSPLYAEAPPSPLPVRTPPAPADEDGFEQLMGQLAAAGGAAQPTDIGGVNAKGVFLQLGAFASADNAESLRSHLARELDWLTEDIRIEAGGGMHRVHLGPYPNRNQAERVADRIRLSLGYRPTFVTR